MTASTDLYAKADRIEADAGHHAHEPDPLDPRGRCRRSCWRCYLDARARLHGRAGDAAKALEGQGS